MIEYGVALLVVCALSLLDRRSLPYALTLSGGWLAGFAGVEWWPFISIASGFVLTCLLTHRSPLWAWLIAACVPLMLLCDAAYLLGLANNVYLGVEYANTLNVLFAVQLLAGGWPGGRRGLRLVVARLDGSGRRCVDSRAARSDGGQGSES